MRCRKCPPAWWCPATWRRWPEDRFVEAYDHAAEPLTRGTAGFLAELPRAVGIAISCERMIQVAYRHRKGVCPMLIGCHGVVWTGRFDTAGVVDAVGKTADAGFDLIEIPLLEPESVDAAVVRKALASAAIGATASLGLSADTDLSSSDPAVVAAGERLLNACLDVLADIGGTHLVGVIYGAMMKYLEPSTDLGRRHSAEAIGRIAARAGDLGITVGLEVVNRYESNLFNTAKDALTFIGSVGSGNVRLHLDTYHMNIEEPDMGSPVRSAGGRLGYVHIGESHRGYLGSGTVDFGTFFRALSDASYDGPIVFESFSSAVVNRQFSSSLAIWRNLWQDGPDLARHANAFIRGQLRSANAIKAQ
jgi:D-psicose/D-tagatose/L-ribulose 3-epimerase